MYKDRKPFLSCPDKVKSAKHEYSISDYILLSDPHNRRVKRIEIYTSLYMYLRHKAPKASKAFV